MPNDPTFTVKVPPSPDAAPIDTSACSNTLPVIPVTKADPDAVVWAALAPDRATTVGDGGEAIPSPMALMATTLNAYVLSVTKLSTVIPFTLGALSPSYTSVDADPGCVSSTLMLGVLPTRRPGVTIMLGTSPVSVRKVMCHDAPPYIPSSRTTSTTPMLPKFSSARFMPTASMPTGRCVV